MSSNQELAKLWIKKAEHDYGTALLIHQHMPEYFDTLGFHCQQAVEKYIKALLVLNNVEFKPKHHLAYLFDLASQIIDIDEQLLDMADRLEQYAVELRYPDTTVEPSRNEVDELIKSTGVIINFIKSYLKVYSL
jgi:HEPN domain-containing protein